MRYFLLVVFLTGSSFASAEVLPRHHNVQCGKDFSCPHELLRRVDFWVDIFALHDNNTAVFHDRNVPERVYSIVRQEGGCGGRGTPKEIKRERARLSALLKKTADKKVAGQALNKEEKKIAALFPGELPREYRKAAERIRCQTGNATRFKKGVRRFGEHHQKVTAALREYGLPEGIQYLPFVESAYNPDAYSRVGAAGLWQLMPSTARYLGLEVNPVLDERMDPELATLAAIRYLQQSFINLATVAREIDPDVSKAEIFPFVMTSYNYGVNGMRRAMREVGVNFINVLEKYKSESFQVAVKNFYASFLAARHVAINREQFFGHVAQNKPVKTTRFALKKPHLIKTVSAHFGVSKDKLRSLNPALAQGVWEGRHLIPRGYVINLPEKPSGNWKSQIASLGSRAADKPPRKMQRYRVRKGNSACGIARKYKVSCSKLVKENRLGKRGFIRVGQILTIPGGSIVLNKTIADARQRIFGDDEFSSDAIMDLTVEVVREPDQKHKIAKGDTACEIAEKYAMSCEKLAQVNQLGRDKKLVAGRVLKIPGKEKTVLRTDSSLANSGNGVTKAPDTGAESNATVRQEIAKVDSDQLNPAAQRSPDPKQSQINDEPEDETEKAISQSDSGVAADVNKEPAMEQKKAESTAVVAPPKTGSLEDFVSMTAESPRTVQAGTSPMEVGQSFGSTDQYFVSREHKAGKTGWSIKVQPDETLGHYADWLGGGDSSTVRRLNGMARGKFVHLGQTLLLPIETEQQKKQFEENRIEYHRALQSQFFEHFQISDSQIYKMKSGDTGLDIANEKQIPLWLLRRFNPDVFQHRYKVGETVIIPVIQER